MTVDPTWDQYMAPALQVLLDGEVHRARDICTSAADLLGVSAAKRLETIPSGQHCDIKRGARVYADSVPTRVVLIDGPRLASLRIGCSVGVQVNQTVHIVEVDEDFFE